MTALHDNQFKPVDYDDPMVERILDAAEQCIARYGIRRTAMGEVARVGKLSRGSIYRHFSDKEALVEGVFRRRQLMFLNRSEALLERESTLVDKVAQSVVQGRINLREGLFARLAETEPETVASMFLDSRFYARSKKFWPPHILLARKTGEISQSVDTPTATDFIMRLAVSMVMFPDMGKPLETPAEIRRYLQQVIGAGLGSSSE